MSNENEWEELDQHIDDMLMDYVNGDSPEKYIARIKNFVQKERILAKIKENHAWCLYFQSEEINLPDMVKHFAAMNMKLQSLLTRFE
jgi:hypothetical protein